MTRRLDQPPSSTSNGVRSRWRPPTSGSLQLIPRVGRLRPVLWASLVLFTGDQEEYRRGSRRLLERFGQTRDANFRRSWPSPWDWVRTRSTTTTTSSRSPRKQPTKSILPHPKSIMISREFAYVPDDSRPLRALDNLDHLLPDWPARTLNDPVRAIVCYRLGRHAEAPALIRRGSGPIRTRRMAPPTCPTWVLWGSGTGI